jgi:hypothetical protein
MRNKSAYALAALETLLELCADEKYLGTTPGVTAVLHTWGQNLCYHPAPATGVGLAKVGPGVPGEPAGSLGWA